MQGSQSPDRWALGRISGPQSNEWICSGEPTSTWREGDISVHVVRTPILYLYYFVLATSTDSRVSLLLERFQTWSSGVFTRHLHVGWEADLASMTVSSGIRQVVEMPTVLKIIYVNTRDIILFSNTVGSHVECRCKQFLFSIVYNGATWTRSSSASNDGTSSDDWKTRVLTYGGPRLSVECASGVGQVHSMSIHTSSRKPPAFTNPMAKNNRGFPLLLF